MVENTFLNNLTIESNKGLTENKGVGYKSTLNSLADFFTVVGGSFDIDQETVEDLFSKAYSVDKNVATRLAFYLRDIRGGQGIRRSFRYVLQWLANNDIDVLKKILPLVPEYGRWDDIICLLETPAKDCVVSLIKRQLDRDISDLENGKSVSLLGKWLPSENTSSKETRRYARILIKELGLTPREYRKTLSRLRERINIVERLISANKWNQVEYSHVPSQAFLKYRNAFYEHDYDRFLEFIESVKEGKSKINTSTTYPYQVIEDIINKLGHYFIGTLDHNASSYREVLNQYKQLDVETLQALWENLNNYKSDSNGIVVVDTSGSMFGGRPQPIAVSVSLGIYFAERNKGPFANKVITFSENPSLIDCRGENIVKRVINLFKNSSWGMNTDIERTFDLILTAAKRSKKKDIPKRIYIVSDMQFDHCVNGAGDSSRMKTVFETIKEKFDNAGIDLPQLIFWNVNTGYYDKGNAIFQSTTIDGTNWINISGFSPVILEYLLNTDLELRGEDLTLKVIETIVTSDRYKEINVE